MALRNGNKSGKGGKRPGAGRKPEDFHTQLAAGLSDGKVLQTVLDMARGENGLWSEKIRLSAAQWLIEMNMGKARQAVEHSGTVATAINIIIEEPK